MVTLIVAFSVGFCLAVFLLYFGGKWAMKRYLDFDFDEPADVFEDDDEVYSGPTFYAAVHGAAVKPSHEGIREARERLKTDEGFRTDIGRRCVEYMTLLGLEKEKPMSETELKMVETIGRLAAGLTIEAFNDAGWFIVDREKLVVLLQMANRNSFEQDLDEEE